MIAEPLSAGIKDVRVWVIHIEGKFYSESDFYLEEGFPKIFQVYFNYSHTKTTTGTTGGGETPQEGQDGAEKAEEGLDENLLGLAELGFQAYNCPINCAYCSPESPPNGTCSSCKGVKLKKLEFSNFLFLARILL